MTIFSCSKSTLVEYTKGSDKINFVQKTLTRNYPNSSKTLSINASKLDKINKEFDKLKISKIIQDSLYLKSSEINIRGNGYHLEFGEKTLFVESINSDFYSQNQSYIKFSKFINYADSIIYSLDEIEALPIP